MKTPADAMRNMRKPASFFFSLLPIALLFVFALTAQAQHLSIQTASGGVTVSGSYSAGFGNVNGLGAGTAPTGTTLITSGVSGGVLYTTPYDLKITGAGGSNTAIIKVYVSANFSNPTTLVLKSCYPSSSCTTAANYTTISTNSGAPTVVIPSPGSGNGTYTASLALFVSNSTTFTGSDSATLSYLVYDGSGALQETKTLQLNSPTENVQSAVRLQLATASGGLTISPSSDFSMNFGNVNALGIGPAAGLTLVSASGGMIYSTPYTLQPSFSGIASGASTLKVYLNVDFLHPIILELRDAAASAGPYTAISKSSGSQTTLTSSAANGTNVTRYLGLFVKDSNGPTAFTGADSATLTYTLTAP